MAIFGFLLLIFTAAFVWELAKALVLAIVGGVRSLFSKIANIFNIFR